MTSTKSKSTKSENEKYCKSCGVLINKEAEICPKCGVRQHAAPTSKNSSKPIKSKVAAGVLGILLGGFGIHKFYLGNIGLGIVYILFAWTFIPAIIGFIEGIIYLTYSGDDEAFTEKYAH